METDNLLTLMKSTLKEYGYTVEEAEDDTDEDSTDEDSTDEDSTASSDTTETSDDTDALSNALDQAMQYIRNFCHIYEIPEGLKWTLVNMACGYFLQKKWLAGALDDLYGVSGAVTSMRVGDTQVSYGTDGSSASERLQSIIDSLLGYGRNDLIRYRRIRW